MKIRKPRANRSLWLGKFPDQVVRLAVIFLLASVVLLVVRRRFIPPSFGELGHYRAAAVKMVAGQTPRYAGWQSCGECHEEQAAKKQGSYHRTVSCETCHGAGYDHAEEDMFEYLPAIPTGRGGCMYCHSYLPSRPTGFPQIVELQHNPVEPCAKCHDPHAPAPSEVPGTCSACHRRIAHTKAVSHHSLLSCETCHETASEHREKPRLHLPTKPVLREFCGLCHAKDTAIPKSISTTALRERVIPRVDMGKHGETYQCWQCHYPHFPEAAR